MADGRKKDSKSCGVCGDKALGSNFNAVTCESCKAFFRRNALKTKEFKCPFNNNCKVDMVTRRFCQRCRLKKCFDIGMKKEWIMTDEEKKAKKAKIEENRHKRSNQQLTPQAKDFTYVKVESPEGNLNQILLSPATSMSPMTPLTPGSAGTVLDLPKNRILSHQPLTPSDCEYSPPTKILHADNALDMYQDSLMSADETPQTEDNSSNFDDSEINSSAPKMSEEQLEYKTVLHENQNDVINLKSPMSHCDSYLSDTIEQPLISSLGDSGFSGASSSAAGITNLYDQSDTESNSHKRCTTVTLTLAQQCNNHSGVKPSILPQSVFKKAIDVEFSALPIRSEVDNIKELTKREKSKLQELVVANEVLKMPLICGISDPSLLDVINMTDHAIRRLIKMSKKINSFKNLCQNDQIALLKGGCTELMILRSVMSYDPEKDCWQGPQGSKIMSIKVDILKEAKGNVYEEHKRFINSFYPVWRTDENIMLILSGIALFTPERPNTVHKEVIKLEQDTYYYLLHRYLETVYNACEARDTYLRLIHKIEELHILNENHVRVYLDVNPKDVEPLLIEIFDLKH